MNGGKPKREFPKLHNFNDMYTPPEAMDYICPYLDNSLIYWEACYGMGHMANELKKRGFIVTGNRNLDCLKEQPSVLPWDFLITNPPFNGIRKFIRRFIKLQKPFATLARIEHLGGVEICTILENVDFKIIIPEKRINYITPKMLQGIKVGGSSFHSIWLTYGVDLPRQINYVKTPK